MWCDNGAMIQDKVDKENVEKRNSVKNIMKYY